MSLLDAYGHVSLPRQMSADAFVRIMDENEVEQAIICTAETCPDLGELARGAREFPHRLRAVGLPVGETARERLDGIAAQMLAGFVGIRIGTRLIVQEPALLDAIVVGGGIPILVGGDAYRGAAPILLDCLRRHTACCVWGAHFAEPRNLEVLDEDAAVSELFAHERFAVICSRHSGQSPALITAWARLLVERIGWSRLLFGSEYPVAAWRNENYADTTQWMLQFNPTPAQRAAYQRDNAHRMLFHRPPNAARVLDEKWTRFTPNPAATIPLFPSNAINLPEHVHQRLFAKYLAEPAGRRGRYADFITRTLTEVAGS